MVAWPKSNEDKNIGSGEEIGPGGLYRGERTVVQITRLAMADKEKKKLLFL
jgi:hypothetical protein